jgi:ribosomal protein S15P/S13E
MAKSARQQAAIAVSKKGSGGRAASKRGASKKQVGALFRKHNMDHNHDGKINRKDFAIMRKLQAKKKRV